MNKRKELTQQRRKMERAIYQKLVTMEEQFKYIEERKQKSRDKYSAVKQKQLIKRQHLDEGLKFMLEDLRREHSDTLVFTGSIYGYRVSAVAMLCSPNYYQVAFAICSPRDRFNAKDMESYLGWRLQSTGHPYSFRIELSRSGGLKPNKLARLIQLHIELDTVTQRRRMPERMYRNALKTYAGEHTGLMYLHKEQRIYSWRS
jgi:hypothetical protein